MKKTYPFRLEIGSTLQVLLHNCNTYQFLGEIYSLEEKLERLVDDEWRALHSQAFSGGSPVISPNCTSIHHLHHHPTNTKLTITTIFVHLNRAMYRIEEALILLPIII